MDMPYDLSDDRAPAMGLIVLKTDELIEFELGKLFLGLGLRVHQTRIESAPDVRLETLATMADGMTAAAAMLPLGADIRSIGYGCTSGATVIGEDRVAQFVNAAHPDLPVTNPLSALKAACQALGVKRLGIVSPYVENVTDALCHAVEADGVSISAVGAFNQVDDQTVAQISPKSTLAGYLEVGAGDCDAVFASCTNLRAMEVIAEAEAALKKPVLCSNQILGWHMLRLSGNNSQPVGYGKLFETPLHS